MADVITFPAPRDGLFSPAAEAVAKVADSDHNRNGREDQGPPIGSSAWTCKCGCFAFYITPVSFHCYECHAPQSFD